MGVGVQAALQLYRDLPWYGLVFFLVLPCSYLDRLMYCLSECWQFKSLPLGLALGSPIFPSGCEGKLGVALESLQGLRDLT